MSSRRLRVLLAEGRSGVAASCLQSLFPRLEESLELSVVASVATMLAMTKVSNPEVMLLDLSLARPDPRDTVRRLHRSVPGVPLIVFADAEDKDYATQCLTEGAMDYMLKHLMDARTLDRVLRAAVERNTLEGLADFMRDPLTGLHSRDSFLILGERRMQYARRSEGTLIVLCAQLQKFQELRGELGPSAANHCVCEAAKLISGCLRRTDIVARVGEARFAAIAVDAAEPSVPILRQRLESRVEAHKLSRGPWGEFEIQVDARFWAANDTATFQELLEEVEAGLTEDSSVPERQGTS